MAKRQPQRDNSGVLFLNDKGDNDKRPDRRGRCRVGGHDYEMAAWVKTDRNGKEYLSVSFQEPRPRDGVSAPSNQPPAEDDLPF